VGDKAANKTQSGKSGPDRDPYLEFREKKIREVKLGCIPGKSRYHPEREEGHLESWGWNSGHSRVSRKCQTKGGDEGEKRMIYCNLLPKKEAGRAWGLQRKEGKSRKVLNPRVPP